MTYSTTSPRFAPVLALVIAAVTAGCSSSTGSTSGGTSGDATSGGSGSGCRTGVNAPFANPAGTPFAIPAGVTLEGNEVTGDFQPNCGEKGYEEYGGDILSLCVGLRNTTGAAITVNVPAGTVFLVKDPAGENGIILQSHDLEVPAGKLEYFLFRPFSINKACTLAGATNRYTFGNVASDSKIAELIGLAKTKKLSNTSNSDAAGAFQPAVWDVTDGTGVTAEHRAAIANLPDQ